jgi:hypothetical protein
MVRNQEQVEVDHRAGVGQELLRVVERVERVDQRTQVHEVDVVAVVLIEAGDHVAQQVAAERALVQVALGVVERALEERLRCRPTRRRSRSRTARR